MKRLSFILLILLSITLSLSAQNKYPRGLLPEADDVYINQIPQRAPLVRGGYRALPPAKSLRAYAPLPKHQGDYGNCTGWASSYCARTILEAIARGWTDKRMITDNAYSPGFNFLQGGGKGEECSGAFNTTVVRSLGVRGSVRRSDMVVSNGTEECPRFPLDLSVLQAAQRNVIPHPITLWAPGFQDGPTKVKRVKRALVANHPVVISMVVPESFNETPATGLWKPAQATPSRYEKLMYCHAMTIVGYDDNRFGGSFEIQNSWGVDWGDGGYAYVKYTDMPAYVYQAFEVFKSPFNESTTPPEELALSGKLRLINYRTGTDLPVSVAQKTRNWTVGGNKGEYTYKIDGVLPRGIRMQIMLESRQPAFVYLLGTGTQSSTAGLLFPQPGFSPAMNYAGYEVAIPSEDLYFEERNEGTNNLLLLYSAEPLDIDDILNRLNQDTSKDISERLDATIRDMLIDPENITFANDEIAFEAGLSNGRKAFAMIIQSNHGE